MKYFKQNEQVFAYDNEQLAQGYGKGMTELTSEELELHINPPKTAEQLVAEWKASRAEAVANIKVTVNYKVYDGDETSQTRMARAISVMDDAETVAWVLADDTLYMATKTELSLVLKLAGAEQTRLWIRE